MSVYLDGGTDRIDYSVGTDFDNLTAITVYSVCRPEVANVTGDLFSHWRYAATRDLSWVIMQHSSANWHWEVAYDDSNNTDVASSPGVSVNDVADEWFIVIGRWKPTLIQLDVARLDTDATGLASNVISRTSISDAAGTTSLVIGAQDDAGNEFNGGLGPHAIWDVYLSDAEIAALQNKAHPLRVRPASRKFIVDLWTINAIDDYGPGRYSGSGTGIQFESRGHPPISPPFFSSEMFVGGAAAPGGISIPVAMAGYRHRHQSLG